MVTLDEESKIFPDSVTDYEFINQEKKHVSFAFLHLLWPKENPVDTENLNMFLSGVSDDGLQKVNEKVVAWRYELSFVQPEISVLCKGNVWVKLLKPKKLFEATVRSILITIQCLHYVKHNIEATKSSIWSHLSSVFSACEVPPSEVDCMNHISLIKYAAERDKTLFNSEYMLWILLEKPTTKKVLLHMIVDFCCGANDFSSLMEKKLDEEEKKCYFKNYDLFPAKNDFSFELRDWFTVKPSELPEGSRLIMGLNPPFGANASLANRYISKALQFKPKLLILIVPSETQRLEPMYDLIWEDSDLLSGRSFNLPGSCDSRDQQLSQWNPVTPPLYLWSRHEWTRKHQEIALRSGQSRLCGPPCSQPPTRNYLLEDKHDCYFTDLMKVYDSFPGLLAGVPLPDHNRDLSEHKCNGNFVTSNSAALHNSGTVPCFENPRVAGRLETNVCSSPVDDLEDMDISPTVSSSNFIS